MALVSLAEATTAGSRVATAAGTFIPDVDGDSRALSSTSGICSTVGSSENIRLSPGPDPIPGRGWTNRCFNDFGMIFSLSGRIGN